MQRTLKFTFALDPAYFDVRAKVEAALRQLPAQPRHTPWRPLEWHASMLALIILHPARTAPEDPKASRFAAAKLSEDWHGLPPELQSRVVSRLAQELWGPEKILLAVSLYPCGAFSSITFAYEAAWLMESECGLWIGGEHIPREYTQIKRAVVIYIGDYELSTISRMVGSTRWVEAGAKVLGLEPEQFLHAYLDSQERAGEMALEASLVGGPLRDMLDQRDALANLAAMERRGYGYAGPLGFKGTAKQLLGELNEFTQAKPIHGRGWPRTPRAMSGALRRIAPALRQLGYRVEFLKAGHARERIIAIDTALSYARPSADDANDRPHRPHRPQTAETRGLGADSRARPRPSGTLRNRPPGGEAQSQMRTVRTVKSIPKRTRTAKTIVATATDAGQGCRRRACAPRRCCRPRTPVPRAGAPATRSPRDHADQPAHGLDQPGRGGHGQGLSPGVVQRQQGHGHHQALRDVLDADPDRERGCRAEIAGAEPDRNRQPFREIVQGDRDHEQPDPPQALRGRTLGAKDEVLVRHALVDQPEHRSAEQNRGGG